MLVVGSLKILAQALNILVGLPLSYRKVIHFALSLTVKEKYVASLFQEVLWG
jgi:hypothetical protein